MLTHLGETLSIIVRRPSTPVSYPCSAYQHAIHALRTELISAGRARLRPTEDTLVFSSLPLIEKHFVNSTDALVLDRCLTGDQRRGHRDTSWSSLVLTPVCSVRHCRKGWLSIIPRRTPWCTWKFSFTLPDSDMEFLDLPLFAELRNSRRIPGRRRGRLRHLHRIAARFGLRGAGAEVHLANLTFSDLHTSSARWLGPVLFEVKASDTSPEATVRSSILGALVPPTRRGDPHLLLRPDRRAATHGDLPRAGGAVGCGHGDPRRMRTDSLMRGDEAGLDASRGHSSIAAVDQLYVANELLVCLGFGVDTFHGVCHAHSGGGRRDRCGRRLPRRAWSLTREMPEVQRYQENGHAPLPRDYTHPSIVSSSILSASPATSATTMSYCLCRSAAGASCDD